MCPITLLLAITEIHYKTPDALHFIFRLEFQSFKIFLPLVKLIKSHGELIIPAHSQKLRKILLSLLTLGGWCGQQINNHRTTKSSFLTFLFLVSRSPNPQILDVGSTGRVMVWSPGATNQGPALASLQLCQPGRPTHLMVMMRVMVVLRMKTSTSLLS